ncbi:hypothetical protein C0992_000026 [Termitomyces sp. T32_za158]|nr:hypothetical protein C0992_000026 [Termitomyces sp. T32_za158]
MVAAGSITVVVRVRPPTTWEAARLPDPCYDTTIRGDGALSTPGKVPVHHTAPLRDIVQIVDDRILTFDPDEKDQARAFVERGFMPPGTKRYKDKRFMFDRVFGHEARQNDVYATTSQPLLKGLFDGYNATVFAYGATGCGKTHTISGTESSPGIIYLTMADLFQRIEDRKDDWDVEVMVTFLEIYNEEIRDLLAEPNSNAPRGGLSIREDKTVKVVGLVELKPKTAEEVKEIVLLGNTRRTQSPTHANETSSRSHAVLQVHVIQSPRTAALTEQRTVATLSIIDLAGSERAAATSNMGQRMVEGANINKSLLALGNCINALCESGGSVRHVPYRNSKLTRLLKFSLGGNCKTVMIVCVAPTSNHFDDTHNTLVYAERATKIKTKVVTRNVVNVDRHVGRYVEAINRLNQEVAELKAKLASKRDQESEVTRRKRAEAFEEVERAKIDIKYKAEQTRDSIVDGAACAGTLTIAKIKLEPIRARLAELEEKELSAELSVDFEAERSLLRALALPEEEVTKSNSLLTTRVQRALNSNAMFEATLRVMSERKSEKLDQSSIDILRLEAACRKAEMERSKAEGERDVMKNAIGSMADVVVSLVGMLGRCTVMVGEAANTLNEADNLDSAKKVARALDSVKSSNDSTFQNLVGASTEDYTVRARKASSTLDSFDGYTTTFTRRISSGPAVLQQIPARRSSAAYGSNSLSVSSEIRRPGRSPRKSLRSSLSQPYRRVSDKKGVKNVQWRDEVGQGDLDDGGPKLPSVTVTIIPPTPSSNADTATSSSSSSALPPRCTSLGSSESDWEDETEKTDDSIHLSLSASLPVSTRFDEYRFDNSSSSSTSLSLRTRRPRASRLDPGFLKSSRLRGSALASLVEGDETASPERRSHNPLSEMSLNQLSGSHDSRSLSSLHKAHGINGNTSRRGPSTPKKGGLNLGPGGSSVKVVNGRRRSNIGPLRVEKGRRRSSLIPQLSPHEGDGSGGPRRVMMVSPAKRTKRVSLNKSISLGAMKIRSPPLGANSSITNISLDVGGDTSFTRIKKATWR